MGIKLFSQKKGVFLTLISISIVLIVVLIVSNKSSEKSLELSAEQFRVIQINNFLTDIKQNYIKNALSVSSHNALKSLSIYILKKESLLDELPPKFSEVAMTGKIDGGEIDSITQESIMANNTMQDWVSKIEEVAKDSFGTKLDITVNSVNIYQSSPWIVSTVANISINLTDSTSNWTIESLVIVAELGIEGYSDPLFLYKFKGLYNHRFNRSTTAEWTAEKLNEHIKNNNYVYGGRSKAPSFIMRFTDEALTGVSECCGIESIVDGKKAQKAGVSGIINSIDHQFFRNTDCSKTKLFSIDSIDSGYSPIYFDAENIAKYKVDIEQTSSACPEEEAG